MSHMKPEFHVLTEDQKESLSLSILEVLERLGVRVDNEEGLELLSSAGARRASASTRSTR
jgi:trimethylamine:corrinoid methyltransferase-like protein